MSKLAKALSASAGNAGGDKLYVEDVFSTFLYTGTASAITVNNGLDLSGEGGLTWLKCRSLAEGHILVDTINGAGTGLISSGTNALFTLTDGLTAFNSNGFTLGTSNITNTNNSTNASWSFRKAEKFFDIQTWSGNDVQGREISHALGSTPGCIICKDLSNSTNWIVYHSGTGATKATYLNTTDAATTGSLFWDDTAPTDSVFTIGDFSSINASGRNYIAYLFASDAGGYGDDGTESIIKCGSYTTDSSGNASVTLGFEPQWVLNKTSSYAASWSTVDMMRGFDTLQSNGYNQAPVLSPNTNSAENVTGGKPRINATGFTVTGTTASQTFIYMAIRRPMKTPESGTEVFAPVGATTTAPLWKSSFPVDMGWYRYIIGTSAGTYLGSRLTGIGRLESSSTAVEATDGSFIWDYMNGWFDNSFSDTNYVGYNFKRATGFMDVVAYTGNGTAGATQAHNLGVVPEMLIVKRRNATDLWPVYHATLGNTKYLQLNGDVPEGAWSGNWNNTTPTASVFSLGNGSYTNASSSTYVAYLFATLAGISKVGSYTGTGSSLNVDCGFTGGARFILIRRYNYPSGGSDWYTYDSFRGITAGTDPYLLLNTTAAQVTGTNYVESLNAGFTVTSNASSTVNVNGGTYIFLAIA